MFVIDQIMIQKVGGWVMISPKEWLNLEAYAADRHLAERTVQFWSHGQMVDADEAAMQLDPSRLPQRIEEFDLRSMQVTRIKPTQMVQADYVSVLDRSGRWVVLRQPVDGAPVNLALFRGHRSDSYDVSRGGLTTLGADLICDSYGESDSSIINVRLAAYLGLELQTKYFGNGSWRLNASTLRNYVERSPLFELAV